MATVAQEASDPRTSATRLQQICISHPELQGTVAKNPSTYPALLEWLSNHGTPEAKAAVLQRRSGVIPPIAVPTAAEATTQVTQVLPAPTAPRVAPGAPGSSMGTPPRPRNATAPARRSTRQGPPATAATSQLPTHPSPPPRAPQTPQPNATAATKKSPAVWLIPVVALLVIAGVATAVWFFFLRTTPEPSSTVIITDSSTEKGEPQDEEEIVLEEASPVEETEEEDLETDKDETLEVATFPAPANAVTAPWFVSETGNIACEMTSGEVHCTIYRHDYNPGSGGCSTGPVTLVLGDEPAHWDCSVPAVSNTSAPVLEYSTSSTIDDFSCLSTAQGMSCWNHFTGDAFALASGGWVTVEDNGVVMPSQMYWID